ncbi:MAG: hypothetical protein ACXVBJ_09440 [Flavisolibacter sp.]
MKKRFLTICLFASLFSFSQSEKSYLTNDSIKYNIVISNNRLLKKQTYTGPRYFVLIEMPKKLKKYFLSKDTEFWMKSLTDTTSDWAANLILYYIYEKDALIMTFIGRGLIKWSAIRTEEIEAWREFLTRRKG